MPASPLTRPDASEIVRSTFGGLYLAEQLDRLHLSIINLMEMVQDEELTLILDQPDKTDKHKILFLEKIIRSISSPELRTILDEALKRKDFAFFSEKELSGVLRALQEAAAKLIVVRISVAIEFKPEDVRAMADLLTEKVGRQTVVSLKVDRSLIGGAIVQNGNYLSDYSIKTQLEIFRSRWHHAVSDSK